MNDYLAAAYLVFLALLLIYVVIMAVRQTRLKREIAELEALLRERDEASEDREMTAA
jgi:hypothetical protein